MIEYPDVDVSTICGRVEDVLLQFGLTLQQVCIAGGCVRDSILHGAIKDIDVFVPARYVEYLALHQVPNFVVGSLSEYGGDVFVVQGVFDDGTSIPVNLIVYHVDKAVQCVDYFDMSINQCWIQDGVCYSVAPLIDVRINNRSRVLSERVAKLYNKYPQLDWSAVQAYAEELNLPWKEIFDA